ncbi:MAG: hypothetical protein EOP11_02205 [Proteobacteria bacterium]|nr:MAG: hypothetical protein EOP11_02205 [Pseudomonadota bacterium]
MRKSSKFLWAAIAMLSIGLPASAKNFTKADIIRNNKNCLQFLRMPRAKQAPVARSLGVSTDTLVKSCRFTTRMGIEKTWAYERIYQRERANGGNNGRGNGEGSSPAPGRPYESSPATAGTCYDLSSCAGSSVHVSSKSSCPSGYGAFKPDLGGTGCEVR